MLWVWHIAPPSLHPTQQGQSTDKDQPVKNMRRQRWVRWAKDSTLWSLLTPSRSLHSKQSSPLLSIPLVNPACSQAYILHQDQINWTPQRSLWAMKYFLSTLGINLHAILVDGDTGASFCVLSPLTNSNAIYPSMKPSVLWRLLLLV